MNKRKYVVSYHTVKYRFGDSLDSLVKYATDHGMFGTMVLYSIKEDGSWDPIDLPQKGVENEN